MQWPLLRRVVEDAINAQFLFQDETRDRLRETLEAVNYNVCLYFCLGVQISICP